MLNLGTVVFACPRCAKAKPLVPEEKRDDKDKDRRNGDGGGGETRGKVRGERREQREKTYHK